MQLVLRDVQNAITVSDTIFGGIFNKSLVHQVITAYLAGSRQGTHAQKNRSKVAGSNRKPWRQKGTGRARSGSVKSPIWRSGGITFAACPKDYSQKVNKKMYRGALRSILSELIRQNRLIIIDKFSIEKPKTKLLVRKLKDMFLENALIITSELHRNLFLSARNLHKVSVQNVTSINPVSLISFDTVVMTADAIKQVEEMLS